MKNFFLVLFYCIILYENIDFYNTTFLKKKD